MWLLHGHEDYVIVDKAKERERETGHSLPSSMYPLFSSLISGLGAPVSQKPPGTL